MEEFKYKLVDATEEEKADFMKRFNDLLNETSMYFEPVPQFTRESITGPWKIVTQVFIQKKVKIESPSAEESVISPIQDVIPPEAA